MGVSGCKVCPCTKEPEKKEEFNFEKNQKNSILINYTSTEKEKLNNNMCFISNNNQINQNSSFDNSYSDKNSDKKERNKSKTKRKNLYYNNESDNIKVNQAKEILEKYGMNKINFGISKEEQDKFNEKEKHLIAEAEINLSQFTPPNEKDSIKIQEIMSNTILNLNEMLKAINSDISSNEKIKGDDNEENILFTGTLKKMVNYEINSPKSIVYSERFFVLFPKMFKYYKSEIQFLKSLKPLCVIYINQISRVNIARPLKSKINTIHFILCNYLGISKNEKDENFYNMYNNSDKNNFNPTEFNESLLIFASDNEQIIYKWYIIFQFLLDYNKKNAP